MNTDFDFNTYMENSTFNPPNELIKLNLSTNNLFDLIEKYTLDKLGGDIHTLLTYNNLMYRVGFVKVFGWSIPSRSSLMELQQNVGNDTVLEIAAGKGLWSALMKSIGMKVITTSISDGHYYNEEDMKKTWTNVEMMDCVEAVKKYTEANCLFLSWGSGQLHATLSSFTGNKLIIVGEDYDGCTDALYEEEDDLENNCGFKLVDQIKIPVWYGIRDSISIYTR